MSTPATRAACLHSCRRSFIRPARWIMATEPTGINRPAITVCVILATLMQALDTTIANVALPHIQGSVSASQEQIAWVLTSYIVAADRLSRRPLRTEAPVPRLGGGLHGRLDALRLGAVRRADRFLPYLAGRL